MIRLSRRALLIGGTALIVAPSIVRASSLMGISSEPIWQIIGQITEHAGANRVRYRHGKNGASIYQIEHSPGDWHPFMSLASGEYAIRPDTYYNPGLIR